jgi:hypothetical protein
MLILIESFNSTKIQWKFLQINKLEIKPDFLHLNGAVILVKHIRIFQCSWKIKYLIQNLRQAEIITFNTNKAEQSQKMLIQKQN